MGIIDSILGRPATQSAKPAPAAPVQEQENQIQQQQAETNPLDAYKNLQDNGDNADESAPSFSIDDEALSGVAGKLNFIKDINPELVQKATSGDAGALVALINATAQQSYRAALKHVTTLTDTHLAQRETFNQKAIKSGVRENLIQQEISTIPNASHPVVQQEIARIARDFAKRSPEATPAQIKEQAIRYFNEVHNAMSGQSESAPKKASEVTDWESFLTS
jgi:hypothetical protein